MTDFPFHRRRTFFAGLLLVAVTLAIYWPVRHFDFVDYDDDSYVFENPDVSAGLTSWGVTWAFIDQHASNWHPLTWISHELDCQIFGVNAGPMHLENVFFHCANSVLLLLLLNSMTGKFWRSAIVAALFALHPLRVESVAWISERKDVLSGFFFILTLWLYTIYAKKIQDSPAELKSSRDKFFYRLSLTSFILGLLSKPMIVTVPLILLLIDFWPLQRLNALTLRRLLVEKLPFFIFALAAGILTLFSQRAGGGWTHSGAGIFSRLEDAIVNYPAYIEKLLWPQNLSFLYLRDKVSAVQLILAALVLIGISMLAAINFRRRPYLVFGWLWFLIMLLPVSGIFELARLSIADRYTYLPAIGFYLMLTWAVADLSNGIFSKNLRCALNAICAASVLIICAMLTHLQIAYWQNTQTLMEHALQIDPDNYVARQNLHIYFFDKKHPNIKNRSEVNSAKPAK